jgi:hypothetical protein
MGTRNLTMVIANGKTKVAQYGQWDGYPEGQGKTALEFLISTDIDAFKKKLESVQFAGEKEQKESDEFAASIGSTDGWMTMEQSELYNKKYPLFTRDNGAKILEMIMEDNSETIFVNDNTEFAEDSLFCEWAYVIDLDKNTFEVYKGFNKRKLTKKDRFFYLQKEDSEYKPVRLYKCYQLDKLPTVSEFVGKKAKAA